jgi:predicted ATPase
LTGEAGIGKSRIVQALTEAVQGKHVRLTWQCSPYHTDSTLWPAIQQISRAAGFAANDTAATKLERLERLLADSGAVTGETPRLLADLLGLDAGGRYGTITFPPAQRRARTLAALLDWLDALARRQPVLWLIEDAHWIDPTTLELLDLALDRLAQGRILAMITARPSFGHGFGGHPIMTRLSLNRLGREQVGAIVARITGGKALPGTLMAEIAARTDGVPLFVEEMTKTLLEAGAARQIETGWKLAVPLAQIAIPNSLHDTLMARLDRLKPVKEVAQIAAVIGRAFDHTTLAALAALQPADLTQALDRLVEAGLVFRRGTPPDATYLFKHALVRDAAYESLLRTRRQVLHLRLLAILEADPRAHPSCWRGMPKPQETPIAP